MDFAAAEKAFVLGTFCCDEPVMFIMND